MSVVSRSVAAAAAALLLPNSAGALLRGRGSDQELLPDPVCKTGVVSLASPVLPAVCCASYCGECTDYPTCNSVRGQDSTNACCASKVYDMRCGGGAPANVCLKKCSEALPPCIMDNPAFQAPDPLQRTAGVDCNQAVSNWRAKATEAKSGNKWFSFSFRPIDGTVECGNTAVASVTASSSCGGRPVTFTENNIAGTCPNDFLLVRKWTATDCEGNANTHEQTVTVQDTEPPALSGVGDDEIVKELAPPPTVSANDNCDGDAPITFKEDTAVVGDTTEVMRQWKATDSCGNSAEWHQTITVKA